MPKCWLDESMNILEDSASRLSSLANANTDLVDYAVLRQCIQDEVIRITEAFNLQLPKGDS